MNPLAAASLNVTESLIADLMETMDGIPEEALNQWKPSAEQQGGGEMNTFAALAVHTASAGHWMLCHQVLGDDVDREREVEFQATATRQQVEANFINWMNDLRDRMQELEDLDLLQMPPTIRASRPDWNRAHWLLHMIDHTALHLGHLQIHRQLWEAERMGLSSDRQSIH